MRPVYRRVYPHRRGLDPSQPSSHHQKKRQKAKNINLLFKRGDLTTLKVFVISRIR